MVGKLGLKKAYALKTTEDSIQLYKKWAATYDSDFAKKMIINHRLMYKKFIKNTQLVLIILS